MVGTHNEPLATIARLRDQRVVEPVRLTTDLVDWWAQEFGAGTPATIIDFGDGLGGGYSLPLTNSGAVVPVPPGKWLSSLYFNGAAVCTRPDEAALRLGSTDVTFAVWMKVLAWGTIFEKAGSFYFGPNALPVPSFMRWDVFKDNKQWSLLTIAPPVNTWLLYIVQWDAGRQELGVQSQAGGMVFTTAYTNFATPADGDFKLGNGLTGHLEQVLRWNRLLKPSERAALYGEAMLNMLGVAIYPAAGIFAPGFPAYNDPPDAPTNLAVDLTTDTPELSWLSESVNEECFQIERKVDGGAWAEYGSNPQELTTFSDSQADIYSHSYRYRVRAANSFGASGYTAEVSAGLTEPDGTNYRFSATEFWVKNSDTGSYHKLSFLSGGPNLLIDAGGAPVAAAAVDAAPVAGNYEFSDGRLFRLADELGLFREFWVEAGVFVFDTVGTSADAGAALTPGSLYRFNAGLFQIYDTEADTWLTPYVRGTPGTEYLELS